MFQPVAGLVAPGRTDGCQRVAQRLRRRIRTTLSEVLSPINAKNIRAAHALVETGKAKGKIVVESF